MIRTEAQLLEAVLDLARLNLWACHHDRPARRTGGQWATAVQGHAGFPDLVLSRRGVVIFRELKGFDARGRLGKLTPEQGDWARQIDAAWGTPAMGGGPHRMHAAFDVWTPDDWDTLIVPTLTAKASVRT